ncbi:LexA family transcriptional regulator [uncultured Gilvimarinus sp.]|uniref:LexA family protein n=1 Tax=uncultured Gilvimarinus sp. TaxID=1689143 RepID=UPI0030DB8EC8
MKTIAERIKYLLKNSPMTQKAVAAAIGARESSITQWKNGEHTPDSENLQKLARVLSTTTEYILYGEDAGIREGGALYQMEVRKVPLISSIDAGSWGEVIDNFQPGDADEWINTSARVSKQAFALRVKGDSMTNPYGSPSIPEGAIVIVDPNIEATSGKIVVAKLTDSQEATIKRLIMDGPNTYLKPLNPEYKAIPVNGNCTIVGVALKVEFDL